MLALGAAATAPTVTWRAPKGCPDAEHARQAIATRLEPNSDLKVAARVAATHDGFSATVSIRGSAGETERELQSPNCATLLDAVGLIAVAAQTASVPTIEEPEPEPEPEPDTNANANTDIDIDIDIDQSSPPGRRRPPTVRAVALHGRAYGQLGWGMTPVVDYGAGLALGLSWRRLRFEVLGSGLAPTSAPVGAISGARAEVFAWSVGPRGCAIAWFSASERVAIPVCAAVVGGELVGRGVGVPGAGEHRDASIASMVGPAILIHLAPWASFVANFDAVFVLRRPGFAVGGVGEVHRAAIAGVRGAVGAEFHFPRRIGGG